MRFLPRGYLPAVGNLSSAIKAGVERGQQFSTLLKTALKYSSRIAKSTVQSIVDYWRGTKSDANVVKGLGASADVTPYVESARSKKSTMIRVGYTIEFIDSCTDEERTWGGVMDFKYGTNNATIYDQILKAFVQILVKYYSCEQLTKKDLYELMNSIELKSVEKI